MNKIKYFRLICGLILAVLTVFFTSCYAADNEKKVIALTFDDGPHLKYTEEVLNILKKNNIHATFFVMGGSVRNHPELLKEEFAAGNVIGNHTYSHPNLSKLTSSAIGQELNKNDAMIYKTIHVHPILFRPPYGACSELCTATITKLGYKKVTWHFLVNDWDVNKTSSEKIADQIIKNAKPGAIMAMHDGGGNREKTVQALPVIIDTLKKNGYQFVTVSELLKVSPYRAP